MEKNHLYHLLMQPVKIGIFYSSNTSQKVLLARNYQVKLLKTFAGAVLLQAACHSCHPALKH